MTAIHHGASFDKLDVMNERERELFNHYSDEFCDDIKLAEDTVIDHKQRQQTWRYPDEYDQLNLDNYFEQLCTTDEQRERVAYELTLFRERNLEKLLRWAVWFMDYVKANNEFIGVGRGSSVSSYCLYLIGLHLVDSIECGLDPREFLK